MLYRHSNKAQPLLNGSPMKQRSEIVFIALIRHQRWRNCIFQLLRATVDILKNEDKSLFDDLYPILYLFLKKQRSQNKANHIL